MKKILICLFFTYISAFAQTYKETTNFSPNDYFLGSNSRSNDPVFDPPRTVSLSADLEVGSDCGRVDIKSTLKGTLQNLLNSQYFEDMGRDIIASSPMLVTCYFSPTWCAILKHTQISAHFLSNMRLDQCSLIDKYTDYRTEVFYQERQQCIHEAIKRHGGNMERAMQECGNSSSNDFSLADWSGKNRKTGENRLLESSASWAGFSGQAADKVLSLAKSLVGDTLFSKGHISIDYGPRKVALTPRGHYSNLKTSIQKSLAKLMEKLDRDIPLYPVEYIIKDDDLITISGSEENLLIDKQSISSLYYLPYQQRQKAIEKLAEAISFNRFSHEMDQTLDLLHVASQNINLPENQAQNLKHKAYSLQESVKRTVELHKLKNDPLNTVLAQINESGLKYKSENQQRIFTDDIDQKSSFQTKSQLFDCADGIMCRGDL